MAWNWKFRKPALRIWTTCCRMLRMLGWGFISSTHVQCRAPGGTWSLISKFTLKIIYMIRKWHDVSEKICIINTVYWLRFLAEPISGSCLWRRRRIVWRLDPCLYAGRRRLMWGLHAELACLELSDRIHHIHFRAICYTFFAVMTMTFTGMISDITLLRCPCSCVNSPQLPMCSKSLVSTQVLAESDQRLEDPSQCHEGRGRKEPPESGGWRHWGCPQAQRPDEFTYKTDSKLQNLP